MKPLALIFSGLQAITFLEAVDLGYVEPGVVLVGGPWTPDSDTDRELRAVATVFRLTPQRLAQFGFARDLVLGDPYSGIGQLVLMLTRPKRLTIVEDGAATYRAVRQIESSEPLVRVHEPAQRRVLLGRCSQRRFARLSARGSLQWITHRTPSPPPQGSRTHSFNRLRHLVGSADSSVHGLIVGSALANDGHIRTRCYLNWLSDVLTTTEATVFLPHRREPQQALELADRLGVAIDSTSIPLERRLLHYSGLRDVYCLPTTGAMTAAALRPDVKVHCPSISPDCWVKGASPGQRDLVRLVESLVCDSDAGHD